MKTEIKILIAFILNLAFSVFEFIGGVLTGSIAIISDAIHDTGDALTLGVSYFLEKKSKSKADDIFTYGYTRYSILGSLFISIMLIFGSAFIIYNSIKRIINPSTINYDGMIIISIIGISVNFAAAYITHGGKTLNQRAVNLHMFEDVLGWIVVLIGAIAMRFSDISIIDPIMSFSVAIFVILNAIKTLKESLNIFLDKTPDGISISNIKSELLSIKGIIDVYHIHVWSVDGENNCATMHIITNEEPSIIKRNAKEKLNSLGIIHTTFELESNGENSTQKCCLIENSTHTQHRCNNKSHCHST